MAKTYSRIILLIIIGTLIIKSQTREPVVAGGFYPGSEQRLENICRYYIQEAGAQKLGGRPIGIIAPHAGYPYSGHVAGHAFNEIKNYDYETIFILAPSHTERFNFASVYKGEYYKTPLGKVEINKEIAQQCVQNNDKIKFSEQGHTSSNNKRGEHAIEVELPFLQNTQSDPAIVPIVFGSKQYSLIEEVGEVLGEIASQEEILIIASSDLSHYHSYEQAKKIDKKLVSTLKKYEPQKFYRGIKENKFEACGAAPIASMLIATKIAGSEKIEILKYANSGDVKAGNKQRVVGYLAAGIVNSNAKNKGNNMNNQSTEGKLNREEKKFLLELAEKSIISAVKDESEPQPEEIPEKLKTEQGAFVTLNKNGNLRGCIGYVEPIKPLWKAVKEMAVSAAMKDPRFPALTESELDDITIEISVLTVPKKVEEPDKIEVGTHGIIISKGPQRGLLLPQVAPDNGWDRRTFLEQTCRKAGLPKQAWQKTDTDIKIFSAQVFGPEDVEE